ncbi:unnamed protein product [Cunninghamella blakesleeana]
MTNTPLLVLTGQNGFNSDLNKQLPITIVQNTTKYNNSNNSLINNNTNNDMNSNMNNTNNANNNNTNNNNNTETTGLGNENELKNQIQYGGETILPKPKTFQSYLPFKVQDASTPPEINLSLLSEISNQFIYFIDSLISTRKLFCSDEYPLSFTGEEAVNITRGIVGVGYKDKFYRNLCRSLMALDPPLFEPVPYSEKSLKKNNFYDSEHEVYTLMDKEGLAQGVYFLLTKCYSPKCEFGGKSLKSSTASSHDTSLSRAWSATIPKEILQVTPPAEVKRQEAIHELIYTEEDYVRDLKLLDELFAKPLSTAQCIEQDRRQKFCEKIFVNYLEILNIHQELFRELRDYQETCHLTGGFVNRIGNIFLKYIDQFDGIYFKYGPNVTLTDYIIKKEMSDNMLFLNFVREKEKQAETRKLPFRHFLLLPVTRLQRYSLLLNAILKKTPDDHPDKLDLAKTIDIICHAAKRMDEETEQSKKTLRLWQIHDQIEFKDLNNVHHRHHHQQQSMNGSSLPSPPLSSTSTSNSEKKWIKDDLQLLAPGRKLLYEGDIIRKTSLMESLTVHLFLFDHYLLITKPLKSNNSKRQTSHLLSFSSSSSTPPPLPIHGNNTNNSNGSRTIDYGALYDGYRVFKVPIPIYLLQVLNTTEIFAIDDPSSRPQQPQPIPSSSTISTSSISSPPMSPLSPTSPTSMYSRHNSFPFSPLSSTSTSMKNINNDNEKTINFNNGGVALSIVHIGRHGKAYTFFVENNDTLSLWKDHIITAKKDWDEKYSDKHILKTHCLTDYTFGNFLSAGKVGESVVYENASGKHMIIFRTNQGLWIGSRDGSIAFQQVMTHSNIAQIGILQDEHILLVLADKTLTAYPLESFDPSSNFKSSASYKVSQHVNYFACGKMMRTSLVIVMKRQGMDSTFKVFQPICGNLRHPDSSKFLTTKHKFYSKAPAWFQLYKSFYIGAKTIDVQILKARLAIVSERGFEIIDLDTLREIHLPNPDDEQKLSFLYPPSINTKPLAMYKYKDYFLLCYNEFAFLVDSRGNYSNHFYEKIDWIGTPHSVGFYDPYIVAFDNQLIEIRHIETGELIQVIPGTNMQALSLKPLIIGVMNHPYDADKQYAFELVPKN